MPAEISIQQTKYWHLRDHHLFQSLNKTQLDMVCLVIKLTTAKKGEIIYFANEDSKRIYFLKKGTIKIVEVNENGDEIIKDVLQKGDLVGWLDENEDVQNEFAIAISESVVLCSHRISDFEQMMQEYPQVALKYTKWLGLRFKKLQNKYANLMFKDVRTRFMLFLKEWANAEGENLDGGIVLKNNLTHQDIASLICSTRQTVSQLFNELRDQKLIDYSRSFIKIIDQNTL